MTGIATISIELELGWGMHDKGKYEFLSSNAEAEYDAISFLLDLCDKYGIPVTFDVVGHLFHETCKGDHQGPYPDNWWAEDPGTNSKTDPLFYAPELIEKIVESDVNHEITTHTYSHILCEEMADELLEHELTIVKHLHEERGLSEPTSIVTPRHQQPNYEILNDFDISVIRIPDPEYGSPKWVDKLGPAGNYLWTLFRKHPLTELDSTRVVTRTYCTPHPSLTSFTLPNGQRSAHSAFRPIPLRIRQRIHENYLQSAIGRATEQNKHIHLWTHTLNLANEAQYPPIRSALEVLGERRDNGDILIKRMEDLPEVEMNE